MDEERVLAADCLARLRAVASRSQWERLAEEQEEEEPPAGVADAGGGGRGLARLAGRYPRGGGG